MSDTRRHDDKADDTPSIMPIEDTLLRDTRAQRGMLCLDQDTLRTFTVPGHLSPSQGGGAVLTALEPALAAVGLTHLTDVEYATNVMMKSLEIRFTHPSLPLRELTDPPTAFTVTHDADGYHVAQGA